MNKARWIYLSVLLVNLFLLALPTSTSLLSLSIESARTLQWAWLVDFIAIIITLAGYFVLRLFYKKHAGYVKNYPYFVMVIALIWTIVIQVK